MVRAVVDTNALVSALIGRGKPRKLVLELLEKHSVVLSPQMLAELADVLSREKFREIRSSQTDRFTASLVSKSKIVKVRSRFKAVAADPSDDLILNTAYSGKADYIVTGDKHMLALKEFKGIEIVKVAKMLETIGQ
ncbi:MAG: putative toxin-antitoxin system toxin component, PIN family [Thaumarchaeota archaeon]|nr:putative toxin-antitoxin system toxin component, PIN family [Nitrososphaerota archaeon]